MQQTSAEESLDNFVEEQPVEEEPKIKRRALATTWWKVPLCCCCCCCCTVIMLVVVGYFAVVNYLTGLATDEFLTIAEDKVMEYCRESLTMANITTSIWWPGCGFDNFSQTCTEPCYDASLLEGMDTFNKANPGQIVYYPSRKGKGQDDKDIETIQLGGWWLPAPEKFGNSTPRIVLQHGFTSNSNKEALQLTAYMLRSMGFGILVNNFRDHCYSGKSEAHVYEWGHAYPYDLLGAWDYAREDPQGLLGGSLPASKVGLQGFSKGAFITGSAFGMEGAIPAAWVDAPPFTPEIVFLHGARKRLDEMGIAFLNPGDLLLNPAWANVEEAAREKGVDLNEHLPKDTLPNGPDTQRPIFWAGNTDDDTVPISEGDQLVDLLQDYPKKYDVSTWKTSGFCHGFSHNYDIFARNTEYKESLCEFWTKAFGLNVSHCDL